MKKMRIVIVTLLLIMLGSSLALFQSFQTSVIDSIAESHISENVPNEDVFDSLLKRDLEAYFKEVKKKAIIIEYELLLKGPTQTGIAYPKFFAWVVIRDRETLIEDGAVRVAAIDKEHFSVHDYLGRAEIERDPEKLYKMVPRVVVDKIKEKIGK